MNKKEKEKSTLNSIYNSKNLEITESEEPDFIVKATNEIFGVEITEFYYNESTARLINYSGYREKILNSKDNSILDKSDIGKLSRNQLYIYDREKGQYRFITDYIGVKYSEKEKMNVLPQCEEIENKLLNIINVKNNKAKKYQQLDYIELIILDKEGIRENVLGKLSVSESILKAVDQSRFKRLYFLSGKYLFVYGINPSENIVKFNNGSDENE